VQFDYHGNYPSVGPVIVPVVPVVSTAFSFKGNYSLRLVGFDVSYFVTVADDKKITFDGCNKAEVSYEAHADGYFKVVSAAVLTRKACHIDFDT
jgi:hypothetical protein